MMHRRTFLCGLTFGALTAPLAVEGQQAGKVWRVGQSAYTTNRPEPTCRQFFISALATPRDGQDDPSWVKGASSPGCGRWGTYRCEARDLARGSSVRALAGAGVGQAAVGRELGSTRGRCRDPFAS